MKAIQIRNVPERVHRTLRARAAKAGVSLSDYLLEELRRIAAREPIADVLMRSATYPAAELTMEDIVAAVHAGRDE